MNNKKSVFPTMSASNGITCCYTNKTDKTQIIRTTTAESHCLERTLFPQQKLLFDTSLKAMLEVSTYETPTAIVTDRIPCIQLRHTESFSISKPSQIAA